MLAGSLHTCSICFLGIVVLVPFEDCRVSATGVCQTVVEGIVSPSRAEHISLQSVS